MKYLEWDEKTWAVDIETDGLRPTCIWVLVAGNMITGEEVVLTDTEAMKKWITERQREGCSFVMHNGLHFDGPVLNDLAGTKLSPKYIIDSMVMSMLYNPSIEGKHSLGAWGIRLDFPKLEHEDWSRLSPEMIERCRADVELTKRVYGYLCRKLNACHFSERSIHLNHLAWVVLKRQKTNGFHFDIEQAEGLYDHLMDVAGKLKEELQTVYFPPVLECVKVYKKAFRVNGDYTQGYEEHSEQYPKLVLLDDGSYEAWDYVSFDPGSPPQRVEKLLELGWKPKEFTPPSKAHPKGQPQPTRKGKLVPSLVGFIEDNPGLGVKELADWLTANSRASMIKTWMNAYNEETKCIHGQLWLASSLRYKHSNPNTANAPAVKTDEEGHPLLGRAGSWAFESRALWGTRDPVRRREVGVDAKGIQLRVLANYINYPPFTEAILSEDPHEANKHMMDLPSRSLAKTITYAIVMGAGDKRIADEAKISLKEAKAMKALFFSKVPGLERLIAKLKAEQRRTKRITLCSGARILVDEDRLVIPYLLQGDESEIMKKVMVEVAKTPWDALQVGMIHDELQFDVLLDDVKDFTCDCERIFKATGEYFNYNLPIECDWKIGLNWGECH